MADVTVRITDRLIINACNTPGGPVYEWRDMVTARIREDAIVNSPINDPMNAQHRAEVVGTFQRSWAPWDRRGSHGHNNIGRVMNTADHAQIVEYGRSASRKMQIFSWTAWGPGIYRVGGPRRIKPKGFPGSPLTKRQKSYNEWAVKYNRKVDRLPERKGGKTGERDGDHVLAHAAQRVMASQGISVSLY